MLKILKRISDVAKKTKKKVAKKVAKKKVTKKVAKKKVAKKVTKKVAKKKITKKVATKKVTKKVAKKKVTKKVTKKVAKKKVTKKVAKKVAKKKVAKKVAKKKVAKKVTKKAVKKKITSKEVAPKMTEKVAVVDPKLKTEDTVEDVVVEKVAPASSTEPSHMLTDEYNPDDEQENNAFGYGWSYDEGLDSPEKLEKETEPFDEDSVYAESGKPVGYDLDKTPKDDDDDMY
jgi:hypothetical protein